MHDRTRLKLFQRAKMWPTTYTVRLASPALRDLDRIPPHYAGADPGVHLHGSAAEPALDEVHVAINCDADIVTARQAARELASRLGFSRTDLTILATAVSEMTRNIVRFAGTGEVVIELIDGPRRGVQVVARDTGPGIPDVDKALADGYSTYDGLGLGLPGARRLMDEFAVVSEPGRGTTVTMTKWCQEG